MERKFRYIRELLQRRELLNAEREILPVLEADSSPGIQSEAHYLLGTVFYLRGKLGRAIDHLKQAIEFNPKHTDAAICLSILYNDTGRYTEARKIFEKANASVSMKHPGDDLGIDRKFALKHLELADMYFRYRRYDEAIDEYTKTIALDPEALDVVIRRAKAYAKKGFTTRAIQELKQLCVENPQYLMGRLQLGLLFYSQGNILDAELEWESVLKADPMNAEARSYLEMSKTAKDLTRGLTSPVPSNSAERRLPE